MLKALTSGGTAGLRKLIAQWIEELRGVMFLTGSANLAALAQAPLVHRGGNGFAERRA